jgi:hypothetical protein
MFTNGDALFIGICLEGFFYGKISVLCALTCTLARSPGSGVYSGIFTIYLQYPSKESRTATIVFYALCLLYVLSTATVVLDAAYFILGVFVNVSDSSKIFFLFQLCSRISRHYRFNFKLTPSQCIFAFRLAKVH